MFFLLQSTDFYHEIEIADFDMDRKDVMTGGIIMKGADGVSYMVPDGGSDLENCHLDMQLAKKQRMDASGTVYGSGIQKQQQPVNGGNRRKMPLVNRIL